jgi:hypothetical protein
MRIIEAMRICTKWKAAMSDLTSNMWTGREVEHQWKGSAVMDEYLEKITIRMNDIF